MRSINCWLEIRCICLHPKTISKSKSFTIGMRTSYFTIWAIKAANIEMPQLVLVKLVLHIAQWAATSKHKDIAKLVNFGYYGLKWNFRMLTNGCTVSAVTSAFLLYFSMVSAYGQNWGLTYLCLDHYPTQKVRTTGGQGGYKKSNLKGRNMTQFDFLKFTCILSWSLLRHSLNEIKGWL